MHGAPSHQIATRAVCLLCIGNYLLCRAFTATHAPMRSSQCSSSMDQLLPSNPIDASTTLTTDHRRRAATSLFSSFYGDFENFDMNDDDDEDDEDDDEDEYADVDERSIAEFKAKMSSMFGDESSQSTTTEGASGEETIGSVDDLIAFAQRKQREEGGVAAEGGATAANPDWAVPTTDIRPGTVLVANPRKFCAEGDYGAAEPMGGKDLIASALGMKGPAPSLLAKFGLTQPPPRHLGADRQADLLPVVIVVSREGSQIQGVLLNRRTGYLLGDLEQPSEDGSSSDNEEMAPILEKFCIQPLWFGGIDSLSVGLDMLHLCPTVRDAEQITEDGIYWGGDPTQAQDAMEDPSLDRIYSGFDFKFFVQSTTWTSVDTIQSEVDDKVWFPASVSQNVLFKSRDRMGTKKAKPLWTEIMDLLGDDYADIMNKFYETE